MNSAPNNFDSIISREGTKAFKTDFCGRIFGRRDVIPLWVADMDFAAPKAVTDALVNRAHHPIYGYTVRPDSYFETLKNWLRIRHNWEIKTEWCLHSPTVLTSLSLGIDTLVPPNAPVVIQTPVYAPFYTVITRNHRKVAENPLVRRADGSYEMDFEHLESLFVGGAKHFIFCNPHNPIGRVWTQAELQKLGTLLIKYGVTVFSDEIHCDLIFSEHRHIPLASIDSALASLVITCISPTKTFNLAGLAVSAIVTSNAKTKHQLDTAFLRYSIDLTNLFAIEAFQAAYEHGEKWLNEIIVYLEGNREFIANTLARHSPRVRFSKPEGTYLAWLDFNECQWSPADLSHKLIHEAGLALEPGTKFGSAGAGFARLNFACPRVVLEEAMLRLEKILP